METRLVKIVSGGQSGVDRAALDIALELGLPCGGWCPKGRAAEDGTIPQKYPLTETPREAHEQRTEWNVRDSDGTLILTRGEPTGGTAYTILMAKKHSKPVLIVDFEHSVDPETVRGWIGKNRIRTLNVAGPRISKEPLIYDDVRTFLPRVLR